MSIAKYNALLKVIEHNSITKAAEDLGYTQSGISYMIKSLEKEVGFPLLVRTKEGAFPTDNALFLKPLLKQLLDSERELEDAIEEIKNDVNACIKVGSYNSMLLQWIPQIVKEFFKSNPGSEVRMSEGNDEELRELLISGGIDIAFTAGNPPEGFKFTKLFDDPFMIVLPKNHLLCDLEEITINDLRGYRIALPKESYYSGFLNYFRDSDDSSADNNGESKKKRYFSFSLKDASSIISFVSNDLAISILPKCSLMSIPDTIVLREFKEGFSRDMGITHPIKNSSPAIRDFIKTAKSVISNNEY